MDMELLARLKSWGQGENGCFRVQNIDTTLPAGMAQARRSGKRIGRPALRHFSPAELERIKSLRREGVSVRKLAKDFETTQWMIARLVSSPPLEGVAA